MHPVITLNTVHHFRFKVVIRIALVTKGAEITLLSLEATVLAMCKLQHPQGLRFLKENVVSVTKFDYRCTRLCFFIENLRLNLKKGLDRVPAILVGNGLLFDVMLFFLYFSFLHLIWLHLHVIVVNLP